MKSWLRPPVSVDWRWSRCVSGRNQMTRRTRDATYNNGKHSLNWCGPCAQEEPSRGPVLAELSGPQIHVAFKAKRSPNALPPGYKTVSTNHPFRVFMCLKYAPHLKKSTKKKDLCCDRENLFGSPDNPFTISCPIVLNFVLLERGTIRTKTPQKTF